MKIMRINKSDARRGIRCVLSVLLTVSMLISVLPLTVIAETVSSSGNATETSSTVEQLVERTLTAVIYADSTYETFADKAASITITGKLPEDITAKAYPVTVDAENVYAAYDITLFAEDGSEYQPESAVSVDISSPEISAAVESGETLTAFHVADDETTESVALNVTDAESVTFDAASFSVYYISSSDETPKSYRRTHKFVNLTEENDPTYEPYYFTLERNGSTRRTDEQIIKNGESLTLPQLPNHSDGAFAGWYIGGSTLESDFTSTGHQKMQFDTLITDITKDETVYLYACYGTEKLLTFYYSAPTSEYDDSTIFYTFPVVIPEGQESVDVYLYDYTAQRTGVYPNVTNSENDLRHVKAPVPSNRNVFLGWTQTRNYSQISVTEDSFVAGTHADSAAIRSACADDNGVFKVKVKDSNDSLHFYPVFDNAIWVNFDGGYRSNGATYQAPVYILTSEANTWNTLPAITRTGYNFAGWYYDSTWDSETHSGKYEYTPTENVAKQLTGGTPDANNKVAITATSSDSVDGKYTISGSNPYYFLPTTTDENGITLHALWTPADSYYTIVYWVQRPEVVYDDVYDDESEYNILKNRAEAEGASEEDIAAFAEAEAHRYSSAKLSNYDYIGYKRVSTKKNGNKIQTTDIVNLAGTSVNGNLTGDSQFILNDMNFDPYDPQREAFRTAHPLAEYHIPSMFTYNFEKTLSENAADTANTAVRDANDKLTDV